MATPSALQGVPIPDPTDADNVPYALAQMLGGFESRLVMRFASSTARDAAITSPVEGMLASIGSKRLTYYDGTAWKDVSGPALPAAVSALGPGPNAIPGTAGAWQNLTTRVNVSITLAAPALCLVTLGAWMNIAGAGTDIRAQATVSGATTDPGSLTGELIFAQGTSTAQTLHGFATRAIVFAAGTTTAEAQGWKTGAPTAGNVNYAAVRIIPVRWV